MKIFPLLLAIFFCFSGVMGQSATVAGTLSFPYPTYHNLAIEWLIEGDTNLNGFAEVRYRRAGTAQWHRAQPLRRVPAGSNKTSVGLDRKIRGYEGFSWINKHSGSIFQLQPNTVYEVWLRLTDPDGGSTEKIVRARTRAVPVVNSHAKIIDLKPGSYDTLRTVSGTAAHPAVYLCTKGRAVIGFIDIRDREWVIIQGLHVNNNAGEGIGIDLSGSQNCVVSHCMIRSTYGIVAYRPGSINCLISDNDVTGFYPWTISLLGASGHTSGEGIQITGPGNVICYNRVSGFRDCISFMEDEHAVNQQCNDIYNNDISRALDDGIEADFCMSNCRIYNNRLTNCYVGLSSQPGLGGPTYFIRNAMYNITHSGFKLKRHSVGDVVLHNTLVKIGVGIGGNDTMDFAYFRNNLAFGGPANGVMWGGYSSGKAYGADVIAPGIHSNFDYDAVGVFDTLYAARIGEQSFGAVEKHGVKISWEKAFSNVAFPMAPVPERKAPDLRLKNGSTAIDAGVFLPNINDGFNGKAPDCGAYESGKAIPHYGPRKRLKP